MSAICLRPYQTEDCAAMAELFCDTVLTVCTKEYSLQQLQAWASAPDLAAWDASFLAHKTLVAEVGEQIVGFADLDVEQAYLDRLYVHRDWQRKGIAAALCDALEQCCQGRRITVHASCTARGFFEKRGYVCLMPQQVIRKGVALTNFVMEKQM